MVAERYHHTVYKRWDNAAKVGYLVRDKRNVLRCIAGKVEEA